MNKPLLILAAVGLAVSAWMLRYDMQAGSPAGAAYVLDRWTGGVRWLYNSEAHPVVPATVYIDPEHLQPDEPVTVPPASHPEPAGSSPASPAPASR